MWQRNPTCQKCGRLVGYPAGFELDHKIPVFKGGPDTEANCQILCLTAGQRVGCHELKTAEDLKFKAKKRKFNPDGWPE